MRTHAPTGSRLSAPAGQPIIEVVRDFDAPVDRVFRAHVDPELVVQWLGPRRLRMRLEQWDLRRGGSYRYVHVDEEGTEYGFWGAVHDVQPGRSITQTFGFDGSPDSALLDRAEFTDLGDGRTRLRLVSVTHDVATRDALLRGGMEDGLRQGHERLDELLGRWVEVPLTELPPAARHAAVTEGFTRRVRGVPEDGWDAPAPVEGWVARDVVDHLVSWFRGFLEGGAGIRLPEGPSVAEDPVGAWLAHRDGVQAVLDDPASEHRVLTNPHLGEVPLPEAIDRFYTSDVFLHTWDLARATGQDETLDEGTCAVMLAGMEPMDELLRSSGQYGPRVDVPPDASVQDRLLGFIGRRP